LIKVTTCGFSRAKKCATFDKYVALCGGEVEWALVWRHLFDEAGNSTSGALKDVARQAKGKESLQ
jgi:hypothetical protein